MSKPSEAMFLHVRVRVRPVAYILEVYRADWDAMSEHERAEHVYDATEESCKFHTEYEVLP